MQGIKWDGVRSVGYQLFQQDVSYTSSDTHLQRDRGGILVILNSTAQNIIRQHRVSTFASAVCVCLNMPLQRAQSSSQRNGFPSLVWWNLTGLHRGPDLNPIQHLWEELCESDLITQHQYWTSLMVLWLNGTKSLQQVPTFDGRTKTRRAEAVIAAR